MAFRAFYSSTVPTSATLHFSQIEYGQLIGRRLQQILVENRDKVLSFNTQISGLTVTAEYIFDSEKTYNEIMTILYSEYPDYDIVKTTYILENNIESKIEKSTYFSKNEK
jgi:hypothetical protein